MVFAAPVIIDPLFNKFEPLPQGKLRAEVLDLARKAGVQPGPALDRANHKFRDRFEAMERLADARDIELHDAGLETLDRLWDEVKEGEPA